MTSSVTKKQDVIFQSGINSLITGKDSEKINSDPELIERLHAAYDFYSLSAEDQTRVLEFVTPSSLGFSKKTP